MAFMNHRQYISYDAEYAIIGLSVDSAVIFVTIIILITLGLNVYGVVLLVIERHYDQRLVGLYLSRFLRLSATYKTTHITNKLYYQRAI